MRKSLPLTLICSCLISCFANAQYVTIADPNFRAFLQGRYPGCFNVAGQMDTTCTQIVNETYLDPTGLSLTNIDALVYFKNLTGLYCDNNQLTHLPALPPNMQSLRCKNNLLTQLPALPRSMNYLDCDNNPITEIPPFPPSMNHLYCRKTNVHCLPRIEPPNVYLFIHVDVNALACIPNYEDMMYLNIYDSAGNSVPGMYLPICNATNNVNQCSAYPIITGIVYNDANLNGSRDDGEALKAYTKIILPNGKFAYTNSEGHYKTTLDSIGSQTVSAQAPAYYDPAPLTYNYNLSRFDTAMTGNFALRAVPLIDKQSIKIIPFHAAARPGFDFPYFIKYENSGTTMLAPVTIIFNYDNTRLIYDSSSRQNVVNNGTSLTLTVNNLAPCESGNFYVYFRTKPNTVIGDSLQATATITSAAATATDSKTVPIRGSFDPNDKQATPQLSPSQVANGEYIEYTIRFQNTGTDTAFNIVISDTLSNELQMASLEMIAASHTCKTTLKGNIVFFEFLNILLPDSNINELLSHGFVSFRIKPQSTIAVNTTIPNKAAIYFDYNAPVITNIANTLIKEFIVVPLKLISFSAVPQNDNTTSLYWNTANEINTKHFVIERSDGLHFNEITNVVAKGRANNDYNIVIADGNTSIVFYRLKIVDRDGSFTYSPVIKIDRRKNAPGFSLLSNLVNDNLVINTTDRALNNTQAAIINMQGAIVKTFTVKTGSQTVYIKELPAGIYYLKTINGSKKFLVQQHY